MLHQDLHIGYFDIYYFCRICHFLIIKTNRFIFLIETYLTELYTMEDLVILIVEERINTIAKLLSELGFDGIIEFDKRDPGYKMLKLIARMREIEGVYAIALCAGINDFQLLKGGAEEYWHTLYLTYREFRSEKGVIGRDATKLFELFFLFLKKAINARLHSIKLKRTKALCKSSLMKDLLSNLNKYKQNPLVLWKTLAKVLRTGTSKKTIVVSMKLFDIANLVVEGKYLDFPKNIPIRVDIHTIDVSISSGIVSKYTSSSDIIKAWLNVLDIVNLEIYPKVNLLRIDSIVWQIGKIIYQARFDKTLSEQLLVKYFVEEIDIEREIAERMAKEFTYNVDEVMTYRKKISQY